MIELGTAITALVIAAAALWRAYVPPQTRKVHELQGRLEDAEFRLEDLGQRVTKRNREENMEQARTAFKSRRAAQDALLEEAQRVLAEKTNQPAQPPKAMSKEELRAQVRLL